MAAIRSLKWNVVRIIFEAHMPAIYDVDEKTGMHVFMLAAVGDKSDLESTFRLLRMYPPAIMSVYDKECGGLKRKEPCPREEHVK